MRFWFGRKSAPETLACDYAPPPWLAGACEEGFVRGYEAQLGEVYRTNPVGLRAVRLVAGAIGGLTVEAEQPEAARLAKSVLEGVGASQLHRPGRLVGRDANLQGRHERAVPLWLRFFQRPAARQRCGNKRHDGPGRHDQRQFHGQCVSCLGQGLQGWRDAGHRSAASGDCRCDGGPRSGKDQRRPVCAAGARADCGVTAGAR